MRECDDNRLRHPLDFRQPESTPGRTYLKLPVLITFPRLILQPPFNKEDSVILNNHGGVTFSKLLFRMTFRNATEQGNAISPSAYPFSTQAYFFKQGYSPRQAVLFPFIVNFWRF